VKSHLDRHGITEFKSLSEVIAFQKGYKASRQLIIANSELAIKNEKSTIISDNFQLKISIESKKEAVKKELEQELEYLKFQLQSLTSLKPKNAWRKIINYFKVLFIKNTIHRYELTIPSRVLQSVLEPMDEYVRNENRYTYIVSRFQDAVLDNCFLELKALERKKAIIDEVGHSIAGAIGEQKVVRELENLTDDYVLINDFRMGFSPPIYNRNENDNIRSIQVDHVLIGPSGVFLIETKNWSEESLYSVNMRSPISQIKRTSFALFMVLNNNTESHGLNDHHWGKKKIALKNLVVFMNQKPWAEFQFVKVLTLKQLLNYIKYFPPIYTRSETADIADELISLSRSWEREHIAYHNTVFV
jgi:hypothetical protein